ncbi:hypothetical protein [Rhizobium sp. S163]|uniref:hypothetical protein n=1 Tax=Rhizobium sp. S163 TaxID=3055039 RepID=UPI0025A9D2E2|nr:hypothetical protein [Rhizobium sp. S163]MDM9644519.1 hypothetical protein [Rhizobium sp. S163]
MTRAALDPAFHLMPKDQVSRVFDQQDCDIDHEFLGFTSIYLALASIIPVHWTVVDLGCAFAPQALIFKDHARYVGVDMNTKERFSAPNTQHHSMPISAFLAKHLAEFDQNTTFAICSYVPAWSDDNVGLARSSFKNVFTYYPAGTQKPFRPSRPVDGSSGKRG